MDGIREIGDMIDPPASIPLVPSMDEGYFMLSMSEAGIACYINDFAFCHAVFRTRVPDCLGQGRGRELHRGYKRKRNFFVSDVYTSSMMPLSFILLSYSLTLLKGVRSVYSSFCFV